MTDSTRVTIANIKTETGAAGEGKALVADGDGNVVLSGISQGTLDHGTLDGLADDDHTQYFLLAGETTDAKLHSGADLIVYSDAGSTEKARIDGATGNITTAGTVDGKDVAGHVDDTTIHYTRRISYIELEPFSYVGEIPCSTGNGKAYFHVPSGLDGLSLVECHAEVKNTGTTGTMSIMIANETQAVDMLTTALTVDSGESGSDTAATPYAIKTNGDEDIAVNDMIRLDFDAVHSTPADGCIVTMGFN